MRFPYTLLKTKRPVYPLGGIFFRPRPVVPIVVSGPLGFRSYDACLDIGTDDTLFPKALATLLGIPLTQPPNHGEAKPVGGQPITYPYGRLTLRLSDGIEAYEWQALVGFIDVPLIWPLLGIAGFFQFFDVQFLGQQQEVIVTANASFSGSVTQRPPSP